ncbi:MAG: hypothetical protein LKJ57_06280 [Ancrocorticia sp.]|jgi:hypothetical protein|nr:hypothetical protein [Ancrocorticia sp.]MCI1895744.1 hypothetical protein [Ancrocorticia sp.]MCI1932738.1 hypothetical protein [Ancrocorticia sp.]MCI1964161.1 hypothetical protein [Ancrocorticia sp.]MCI2002598.1 hypothetical protein [Ancrocorticia sp.]
MNNRTLAKLHRAQAELESARREIASIDRFAPASRFERAEFRLSAAEKAMQEVLLAA